MQIGDASVEGIRQARHVRTSLRDLFEPVFLFDPHANVRPPDSTLRRLIFLEFEVIRRSKRFTLANISAEESAIINARHTRRADLYRRVLRFNRGSALQRCSSVVCMRL